MFLGGNSKDQKGNDFNFTPLSSYSTFPSAKRTFEIGPLKCLTDDVHERDACGVRDWLLVEHKNQKQRKNKKIEKH